MRIWFGAGIALDVTNASMCSLPPGEYTVTIDRAVELTQCAPRRRRAKAPSKRAMRKRRDHARWFRGLTRHEQRRYIELQGRLLR